MIIFKKLVSTLMVALMVVLMFSVTVSANESDMIYPDAFYGEKNGNEYLTMLPEALELAHNESKELSVEIPKDGEYEFNLLFLPKQENAQTISYSVLVDGSLPFEGAELLDAFVYFCDDGEKSTLSNGDETPPEQKQLDGIMKSTARDKTGVILKPYTVALSKGTHNVKITGIDNSFYLVGISFVEADDTKAYEEVEKLYIDTPQYEGKQLVIEAENPVYRNDFSLTAKSDNSSADLSPSNVANSVLNYVGGSNWSAPGQEIAYEIDVPSDGLYRIGFSFKQNTIINGSSYRILKIDGKAPFAEAEAIAFPYKTAWQYMDLKDAEGDDMLLKLSKGKHIISLSVTLAGVSEIYYELNKIATEIGEMYLDIVMITGESPDSNRDYELYKQIPDYEKKLTQYYNELMAVSKKLNTRKDINGQLDGAVKNMARICKNMSDERYSSHLYVGTYFSNYQTLSSWLYDIRNMALSLDKIVLSSPKAESDSGYAGFFEKIVFSVKRFILSFSSDYSNESLKGSDENIKIWVNWGRDQVKVLNNLIQKSFSKKTGINVLVEQVNASLVQGIISNNSPDLYLHMARTEPVNLAMRGVLYDLKNFNDYEEVLKNFQDGADIPYLYKDGLYAIPDTQGFYVMFCRDDILEKMGLEVPKTWQDFLSATSVLQRKNMNSYLPYTKISAASTVNTGAGGLNIFPTMLMQNGGSVYNKKLNGTELASPISVSTFKFWSDFYKDYKLAPDANFYQRFRVGTIPLGIANYTQYQTFAVAASEIEGKWSVYPIPGVMMEDGTINNICSGSGTGCGIMKSSKNKAAAWEFLKWWVSEDTQYSYSFDVEAIIGQSGRVATSNVKALSRLSWDRKSLSVILEQWGKVRELNEVPGSYYVSRSIDQAFWAVNNGESDYKTAITDWAKTSDNEIKRKIKEYANKKY